MSDQRGPLHGVRILEVAQSSMVPSAAAVLRDWGATVVKIEQPGSGDPQRDIARRLGAGGPEFEPTFESPNRGKRSVALDLADPRSRSIMARLIAVADVFLTSVRPAARSALGIDEPTVHAANPGIVYASGSGFGRRGREADRPGYDATAYWARGAGSDGSTPPDTDYPTFMPSGAFGDLTAGLAVAGGVAAALFARAGTGRGPDVDVSLLATAAWVNQFQVNTALARGGPLPPRDPRTMMPGNPLVRCYRTADGRWLQFTVLRPAGVWTELCRRIGREDLSADPRFADIDCVREHYDDAVTALSDTFATRPLTDWIAALDGFDAAWAVIQDAWEVGNDESLTANGRFADVVDAAGQPQRMVVAPVDFGDIDVPTARAPRLAEHTDEVLGEVGVDEAMRERLRAAGVIA